MGNSAFNPVNKAMTSQGGDTGTSPNQTEGRGSQPGATSKPAPRPRGLTYAGGATTQGADMGMSPNTTRQGYGAERLKQPGAYTGGGGKGEVRTEGGAGGYGTTDGATIPYSPNQAATPPSWAPGKNESMPIESGSSELTTVVVGELQNGAAKPGFDTGALARQGMGSGAEMPVMARGIPPMARIASGDLRRGMAPMDAEVARPTGSKGPEGLAGFARKGGYVPLDPQSVRGKPQAPTAGGNANAPWGSAATGSGAAPGSA